MKYTVICANIGTVHETNNRKDAENVFREYIKMSKDRYGRASGEDVYLFRQNNLICEYIGDYNDDYNENDMES